MTQFVVTANRLGNGEVVYLTEDGRWSVSLQDSRVVVDDEAKTLLVSVEQPNEELWVIDPYLMKIHAAGSAIEPLGQRETIRARGPTTHLHFGKQAEAENSHV
jgi:hypothetical protein